MATKQDTLEALEALSDLYTVALLEAGTDEGEEQVRKKNKVIIRALLGSMEESERTEGGDE